MQGGLYRSVLRIGLLVVTSVLLFDGGFLNPITKQLSNDTISYLANVGTGVFASVPQTEINTLSAQLRQQQDALNEREAVLEEREIASRSYGNSQGPDYSIYILSAILFILTVLIVLNFAMDWARVKAQRLRVVV